MRCNYLSFGKRRLNVFNSPPQTPKKMHSTVIISGSWGHEPGRWEFVYTTKNAICAVVRVPTNHCVPLDSVRSSLRGGTTKQSFMLLPVQ